MRVGIDGSCLKNARGYGRFITELVGALVERAPKDEFILFADGMTAATVPLARRNLRVVGVDGCANQAAAAAADGHRSVGDMLRMRRAVSEAGVDVFFSPSVYTYFPLPWRQRAVVTIHDAIAERFPKLTLPSVRARLFWKAKVWLAVKQARFILTVSEFAAREIEEVIGIPRSRIRVAVEAPAAAYRPAESGAEIAAAAARNGLPPGAAWFGYVGGFNPHKNVDALVRAHARLVKERSGDPPYLVLTGPVDHDNFHGDLGRIRAAIAEEGTERWIRWTGFLPDEELRLLHSGSRALVLPSECEGFGLPAVEAAACGAPVIATTRSPLPELLAGGGIFVAPRDVEGLAAAMSDLLADPRRRDALGAVARERAARLSWSAAADAALAALREAAA